MKRYLLLGALLLSGCTLPWSPTVSGTLGEITTQRGRVASLRNELTATPMDSGRRLAITQALDQADKELDEADKKLASAGVSDVPLPRIKALIEQATIRLGVVDALLGGD